MRAIVYHKYGSPDELELKDIDKPAVGDDSVLTQKLRLFLATQRKTDLIVLKELIEDGKVTPVIDRTYPLSATPAAIRYLEEGHAPGKVVITV